MMMSPRREEKVVVAEITLENLKIDKVKFKAYSDMYDDPFIADYEAKIAIAKALETVEHLRALGKSITEALYIDVASLIPIVFQLEGYVKRATGLSIALKDFGISEVRDKAHRKEVEGLDICMSTLISNIEADDNKAALIAKGYKEADLTALKALKVKIDTENVSQTLQDENQAETLAANNIVYDELDAITKDIMDAGKRIFKFSDKTKLAEYTYQKVMRKIRHETNQTKEEIKDIEKSCVVYVNCDDADGNPIEGLTVTIIEYNQVVETDEEGIAYFEKVPTDPIKVVNIKVEGETWITQNLENKTLEPGIDMNFDVTMLPEPPTP